MLAYDVNRVMNYYPKIFFACRPRHFTEKKSGVKLSTVQLSIIDHLDHYFPTTLTELAMHQGVTPSTMSLAIDRLVTVGLVCRQKDEEDRRKTNLTLTPGGDAVKRSRAILDRKQVEDMLSRIPDNVREKVLSGLQVLADAAEGMLRAESVEKPWNRKRDDI